RFGRLAPLWDILHRQAVFPFRGALFLVAYPLLPWVAVMAAGFCFGNILLWDPERRRGFLVRLGLGLIHCFRRASRLESLWRSVALHRSPRRAFHRALVPQYHQIPSSLAFLLMTLGPALIALAFLDRRNFSSSNPLIVFGRVPLFFFLFHLAVVHGSRCRPEHVARRPSSFPPAPATLSRRLS